MNLIDNSNLGDSFYGIHRYDEAIDKYQKTLELDANFSVARWGLGSAYAGKGMYKEAVAEWIKALNTDGDAPSAKLIERAYSESGYKGALHVWVEHLSQPIQA